MKKLITIAICTALFGMANMANATSYSVDVDIWGDWLKPGMTQSWSIPITNDFQIPYDTLQSAILTITAISKTGEDNVTSYANEVVTAIGTLDKSNKPKGGPWEFNTTVFPNIASIFTSPDGWPKGQELEISVLAGGTGNGNKLKLGSSTLTLEYTNFDAPLDPPNGDHTAPVPEPATLLLLGSGLSGLAFWGKRRRVAA